MSAPIREIEDEALDWLVRLNDPDFERWDAWERWLEADPLHATTYWRLAEAEAEAVEALAAAPVHADRRVRDPARGRRTLVLPRQAALAAAFALMALGAGWFAWTGRPQPWTVETAPGERRAVVLADGSRAYLDGATRLALDRKDPRDVTLVAGRALFEVVHDDRDPFRVVVGEATLTDLGTTFDVTRLPDGARVEVSEGRVRVDRGGASTTLDPGEAVVASAQGLERRSVSPEAVGGWRDGRLSWTGETLAVVAQDLERVLGHPVSVAPSLAGRRFSGSLTTEAPPPVLRTRLSRLLDVTIVEDGPGWRLEP